MGGLYGNGPALDEIERIAGLVPITPTLVFNGDFHWFDIEGRRFESIDNRVGWYLATCGYVKTELSDLGSDIGCGCAHHPDVDEQAVKRSDAIWQRLRNTASRFPDRLVRLARIFHQGGARTAANSASIRRP